MMLSRAASLRRLAASAAAAVLSPAAEAPVLRSSPLSTTTKRAPKKAAVPAPEAEAVTAPQQAARGSSPLSTTTKRAPKKAAVPAPEAAARDHPFSLHFDPAEVKCPTEIPFQPQIANTVHLVGTVGVRPVLEEKSKGEYQAVSVIVEKKDSVGNDSLQLWIPVIFQGDLAQIAACHLKENDLVYIVGHLSGGEATTKVEDAHSQIRIFARSLNFVESNSGKDDKLASEQDKKMASDHLAEENSPTRPFWNDLLSNPHNWLDNRAIRNNPSSAAFKHKDEGQLLWLNEFTPKDVLSRLDTLAFYNKTPKKNEISGNVMNESWWTDVFAKKKDEDLWKDLIENPTKWWDRRLDKGNPKAPDFKHKDSGDALWLSSAPLWAVEKLPLPDSSTNPEDLWKDLIENPTRWWDRRLDKLNPKAPDFKHKDSGVALWLDSSPSWVLEKLPPAENITNSEDMWKDVIEKPSGGTTG